MKPFYVIVHAHCIELEKRVNIPENLQVKIESILAELDRIRREEKYAELTKWKSAFNLDYKIPEEKEILVCGAYEDLCVAVHTELLVERGQNARIYSKACLSSEEVRQTH